MANLMNIYFSPKRINQIYTIKENLEPYANGNRFHPYVNVNNCQSTSFLNFFSKVVVRKQRSHCVLKTDEPKFCFDLLR
jgi:hypothetical protein